MPLVGCRFQNERQVEKPIVINLVSREPYLSPAAIPKTGNRLKPGSGAGVPSPGEFAGLQLVVPDLGPPDFYFTSSFGSLPRGEIQIIG